MPRSHVPSAICALVLPIFIMLAFVTPLCMGVLRCYECQGSRDTCERNHYVTVCNDLDRYCEVSLLLLL